MAPFSPVPTPVPTHAAAAGHNRGVHLPSSRRAGLLLALVLLPLGLAALVGMLLTWPDGEPVTTGSVTAGPVEYPGARVVGSERQTCEATAEDRQADGTIPDEVTCLRVTARVTDGPEAGREVQVWATAGITAADVPAGTSVVLERYPASDEDAETWAWHDFSRSFPLLTLALVFAALTVLVAGMRGLRALLGLAVAFTVIGAYVLPALLGGADAIVVALCASTVIMVVVLYLAHGFSARTSTALLGTLVGLGLTAGLGVLAADAARLSGVTSEDSYRLAGLLGEQGATSLRGLFLCGLVLAGLGVLNDVTITQASAVWELRASAPATSRLDLFRRGMRIGRDHIASTVYTIAFAYTGAALPVLLLVQLYELPLGMTLTSGEFAEEIVRTLVGSIGLVLAIPLTTALAVLVVTAPGVTPARHRHAEESHGHAHGHTHASASTDTDLRHG